jgi:hypothetical protein
MIKALFSRSQSGPCVVYGEGGLEKMLGDFYGIQDLGKERGQWTKMYVFGVWF